MPLTHVQEDAALAAQQASLIKLADEYCEMGNQYVVSAALWARPVIADLIAIVRERHQAISKKAEIEYAIGREIVTASDQFLDESIEIVVATYPLTASYNVRAITSKVRNELAIMRLEAQARAHEFHVKSVSLDYTNALNSLKNKKITSKKFQELCQCRPEIRDAVSGTVFTSALFQWAVLGCIADRQYTEDTTLKKAAKETYFSAFQRYWSSFPHGQMYLALAIKKLIHDDALLKRVIRYRVDVHELLLVHCPTPAMRKYALHNILKNNYLSLTMVVDVFELLPEASNINWRVDFAEFGIKRYQFISQRKTPTVWANSKNQLRAEVFAELCDHYRFGTPLEKKILIYALLQSHGHKMQRLVCKAMGYSSLDVTKKIFYASLKQDADIFKINLLELEEHVIRKIIANVNAGKPFASGAYKPIIEKLKQFIPSPLAVKSTF